MNRKQKEINNPRRVSAQKILITHKDSENFANPDLTKSEAVNLGNQVISKIKPEMVFTTPNHDLNKDHQIVFESTVIATRSITSNVKDILSYELPGAVKTPFSKSHPGLQSSLQSIV